MELGRRASLAWRSTKKSSLRTAARGPAQVSMVANRMAPRRWKKDVAAELRRWTRLANNAFIFYKITISHKAANRHGEIFPDSSMVEQPAVNRFVEGSSPSRGALSTDCNRCPPISTAIAVNNLGPISLPAPPSAWPIPLSTDRKPFSTTTARFRQEFVGPSVPVARMASGALGVVRVGSRSTAAPISWRWARP